MHVSENPQLHAPLSKILEFNPAFPYYPVTLLTYKLDHLLFSGWMPTALGSWAPGVRFMSVLYHAAAALVIWRILLLLRLSRERALFIACAFAVHPLASETVCWTSERKNAVAALLGFLGLWAWVRWENSWRGVALGTTLFGLALFAKQSALSLLPVMVLFDLFGGTRGLAGEVPTRWKPGYDWLHVAGRALPPTIIAIAMVVFTIRIMNHTIVPPPGGSLPTALLTDVEILARYLFNLTIPVNLSAVYLVDPIRSVGDWRLPLYGGILVATASISIRCARNRRMALFGWLWFLGALGPNLNLVSIPHLMQDRYIYMSTPGFLLVVVECAAGLADLLRVRVSFDPERVGRASGILCILLFAVLGFMRGPTWNSSRTIFEDATAKQPLASYARYGLGNTYKDLADFYSEHYANLARDPRASAEKRELARRGAEEYHKHWMRQWAVGVACPDSKRYNMYLTMALALGYESLRLNRPEEAVRYWTICLEKPLETIDDPMIRAEAAGSLAALKLDFKHSAEAYELGKYSLSLSPSDPARILVARAALALALEHPERGNVLRKEAAELLSAVPQSSPHFQVAQDYLKQLP